MSIQDALKHQQPQPYPPHPHQLIHTHSAPPLTHSPLSSSAHTHAHTYTLGHGASRRNHSTDSTASTSSWRDFDVRQVQQQQQHRLVHAPHLPSPPASTCSAPEFDSGIADADDPWYQPQLRSSALGEGRRLMSLDMSAGPHVLGMEESWRADEKRGVNGTTAGTETSTDTSDVAEEEHEKVAVDKALLKMDEAGDKLEMKNLAPPPSKDVGKGRGRGRDVTSLHILAKLMDTSKGRDKVLKCFQYSFRTYLYLLTIISRVRPLSPWFKSNRKRINLAVSGLSLTRKCLLLLNPLHPLTDLLSPEPMAARTLIMHLVDLLSALSDDIYCLGKLGLVSKRTGAVADRWSNRFWLLTTLIGLYKLHLQTLPRLRAASTLAVPSPKQKAERSDAEWTNRKLLADLAFVSYDVFELHWPVLGEPMKCAAGLTAAFISTMKLYNQHWDASVGKG
ncbi:hypothetical protein IAT38_000515 [Cryptococcus sp. DSM 104549]